MRRRSTLPAVAAGAVFVLLMLAACGGTQVGNASQLPSQSAGAAAIGQDTATPSAAPSSAPQGTPRPTRPPATPAATPPPAARAQHFAIAINGDNQSSSQFDPSAVQVPKGTIITWTNRDAAVRSVVSDDGLFNSGPIAPGSSWSFTASADGKFSYHDGTRPYAIAFFQVVG